MPSKFHILLVRFSSLGDMVLHSSVIHFFHHHFGDRVELTLMTSEAFVPLYDSHPYLKRVIGIKRIKGIAGLRKLKQKMDEFKQQHPVDLMLDLHGTLRSLFLRLCYPEIPRLYLDKRTLERWLLTGLKIDLLSSQFQELKPRPDGFGEWLLARYPRDLAGVFLGHGEYRLPARPWSSVDLSFMVTTEEWPATYTALKSLSYVVLVPSASYVEKRWPFERFLEYAEKLLQATDHHLLILAGKEDDFCQGFAPLSKVYPDRFHNAQGQTSLTETVTLLKHAKLVVGNDTGLPHLAEAVGTKALFLLGPTGEEFGFYPHLEQSAVISKSLWCRPCTTNGKGNCIRSERFCLTMITVDEVLKKSLAMLNS